MVRPLEYQVSKVIVGSAAPARPAAWLANVDKMDDNKVLLHWTMANAVLPEYAAAAAMICVEGEWMRDTMLLRHIRHIAATDTERIAAIVDDDGAFARTLEGVICKAYALGAGKNPRDQKDILSGQKIFGKVSQVKTKFSRAGRSLYSYGLYGYGLYSYGLYTYGLYTYGLYSYGQVYNVLEGWKKPLFIHAWQVLLEREADVGAIVSKLSEVVDHSMHCPHVQVKSFQLLLSHCSRLVRTDAHSTAPSEHPPAQGPRASSHLVSGTAATTELRLFEKAEHGSSIEIPEHVDGERREPAPTLGDLLMAFLRDLSFSMLPVQTLWHSQLAYSQKKRPALGVRCCASSLRSTSISTWSTLRQPRPCSSD